MEVLIRAQLGFTTLGRDSVGRDAGWAISIASAGSYVKPAAFTISANLNLNGMTATPSGIDINTVGQTWPDRRIAWPFR